jgi:hypothetical protein
LQKLNEKGKLCFLFIVWFIILYRWFTF